MKALMLDAPYEVAIIDSDVGLADIAAQWQALENADPEATPFNTYAWSSLWWKHYKKADYQLHIVKFSLDGDLIALAPLYLRTHVQLKMFDQRELRWLGSGGDTSPDYLNVICLSAHRNNIVKTFSEYLAEFDGAQRICLSDIALPSALHDQLRSRLSACKGFLAFPVTNTLFTADLPATFDEYRMALSRKRRKQINHRRNRLDQAGDWSLSICETDEERHAAVIALEELHRDRWVSKGAPGAFVTDAYVNFHEEIIETFTATNQLWLVRLVLDGKTIGVLYLFLWRNTLLFFQSGFSPDHESLSPGHTMFTYVIGEAIERGIERIDLLKGDYKYKKVYAKSQNKTIDLVFVRPGFGLVLTRSKQFVKSVYKPQAKLAVVEPVQPDGN